MGVIGIAASLSSCVRLGHRDQEFRSLVQGWEASAYRRALPLQYLLQPKATSPSPVRNTAMNRDESLGLCSAEIFFLICKCANMHICDGHDREMDNMLLLNPPDKSTNLAQHQPWAGTASEHPWPCIAYKDLEAYLIFIRTQILQDKRIFKWFIWSLQPQ